MMISLAFQRLNALVFKILLFLLVFLVFFFFVVEKFDQSIVFCLQEHVVFFETENFLAHHIDFLLSFFPYYMPAFVIGFFEGLLRL